MDALQKARRLVELADAMEQAEAVLHESCQGGSQADGSTRAQRIVNYQQAKQAYADEYRRQSDDRPQFGNRKRIVARSASKETIFQIPEKIDTLVQTRSVDEYAN